jgi:ribosomal protein S1
MMSDDKPAGISEAERALIGTFVTGTVEAVFRWGVIVDLHLSHVGFIDPLYIDDDSRYEVGQSVRAYLTTFDEQQGKFWLRPPGQVPIADRLRRKGHDV